jgi:hypothetical protein
LQLHDIRITRKKIGNVFKYNALLLTLFTVAGLIFTHVKRLSLKRKMTDITVKSHVEAVAFVESNYIKPMFILSQQKIPPISEKTFLRS